MLKQKILLLRLLCIVVITCLYCNAYAQQNVTISGKVSDSANNAGIQGVSVTLKGNTKTGTVTKLENRSKKSF